MNTRIEKKKLLDILAKNKKAHRGIFEEAVDGYRKKAISTLEENLKLVKANKKHRLVNFYLQVPEDHTRDYERAIKMIEMTTDQEILLGEQEFKSFVMDDWSWAAQFYASNSLYSATAAGKLQDIQESGDE